MATITSRLPALIHYLLTLFPPHPPLTAANPQVTIFDGPPPPPLDAPLKLYVGLSAPDNTAAEPAGDTVQQWASLGRRARDETVTVHFCAEAWSGSDAIQAVRLSATGIVAAVATLLQADTTQFGG